MYVLSFRTDFEDYSELCFKLFGDRVKNWFTINEPTVLAVYGYEVGIAPPGKCSLKEGVCVIGSPENCLVPAGPCDFGGDSSTEPFIVAHNLILAHATAVKLYKEKYQVQQKGEIGIVLASKYFVPLSETQEDKAAAERLFDFNLGWFMEPFMYGDYPKSMKELVKKRLPTFSAQEKGLIKGSLDFVGINYYISTYARHKTPPPSEKLRYSLDISAEETCKLLLIPYCFPNVTKHFHPMEKSNQIDFLMLPHLGARNGGLTQIIKYVPILILIFFFACFDYCRYER